MISAQALAPNERLDPKLSGSSPRYGRRGRQRRPRFDVVFYTPFVGSILSSSSHALPPGGAETQILMLAKELARRGLQVAIIVFGAPAELPPKVAGVTLVPRPMFAKRRLIGKFIELLRMWQALRRVPSKTIVFRGMGLQLGLLALYARIANQQLIFSSANVVDFDCRQLLPKRRDAFLYVVGARSADVIVVQTEEQIEMCQTAFARRPELIKSIQPLAKPQAEMPQAFLWVGRLVSYKCPLEYLALAQALPKAAFWMVGVPPVDAADRSMADEVIALASRLPNLKLLPPRNHADLQALMGRAVASVNTATFEGMPNVLLEAWARGVPALVLTHDPGGVVCKYGLGGFANGSGERLVELARAQWHARNNRAVRHLISERCRAYIEQNHAPSVVVDQWIDVLRTPLSKRTREVAATAGEPTCAE